MITKSISHELIIEDLKDIPSGQILVLLNPDIGITSKTVFMIDFIFSMAKQFDKFHIVDTKKVEYSELWDCFACKKQTSNGEYILVSDKDSLIEMLSEFWRLDYKTVCSEIKIAKRNKTVTCGGDSGDCHPIRVSMPSIASKESHPEEGGNFTTRLGLLQNYSRDGVLLDIKELILNNFNYNLGITLEDIKDLYESEKNNIKKYTLDIDVQKKDVFVKGKPAKIISGCDIKLIDNQGKEYTLDLRVYSKALYLTFLLYEGKQYIWDISGNEEFYNRFKKIYLQLPYGSKSSLPVGFDLLDNKEYTLFIQKIGKIRDAIMAATHDNFTREMFAVEGNRNEPIGIAGATEEHRNIIKKEFGVE